MQAPVSPSGHFVKEVDGAVKMAAAASEDSGMRGGRTHEGDELKVPGPAAGAGSEALSDAGPKVTKRKGYLE
jgi:hypothetical protein